MLSGDERSFADWTDLLVASVCVAVLLFAAGWIAHEQYEARKPRPVALVRIEAKPAALTQWSCTKQEFREHLNACAMRERMGRVQ